jgi:hypothetical protein
VPLPVREPLHHLADDGSRLLPGFRSPRALLPLSKRGGGAGSEGGDGGEIL